MKITEDQKNLLLTLARKSIESIFDKIELPKINEEDKLLNSNCGAFVTLTKFNELRGCIGYITSEEPLWQTIIETAELAATRDPRFPKITKDEIEDLSIEISILSEPFQLNSYEEVEVGKHGLILNEGMFRGVLLPQVPIEHNLNREQYLSALCNKAGLPRDEWKKREIKLKAFTAEVFSENELGKTK
ncbi:MAG: AMMECR1 domain-containing protein [Ignavibacteriae bacterium]|nr:AMMECR1 domain-containing protein [Ignavibacteriota bacterium]